MNVTGADGTYYTIEPNADLSDAGLWRASLRGAYLIRADLTDVCLNEANLGGANLTNANLSGAVWSGETVFPEGFEIPEKNET